MLTPPRPRALQYSGRNLDPTRWDRFAARKGDIVVCAPAKSGTTWMQGILALLISGDAGVDAQVSTRAPWLDVDTPDWDVVAATLAAQTGRRQIKTHTPFDGMPFWSDLRYVCVYRHPLDVHFSFRAHVAHMRDTVMQDVFPTDVSEGFRIFLDGVEHNGANLASILDHYDSALALNDAPNVLRLHYGDMLRDLAGSVARIAAHVELRHADDVMARLVAAARFDAMKANAGRFAVAAGQGFWRDDGDFFARGGTGRWKGHLSDAELAAYDLRMSKALDPAARHWLECGSD